MVNWDEIDACSPMSYRGTVQEKLKAIVSIAGLYIKMYTGPGDEEDSALSTIYALASAALDEVEATHTDTDSI